MTQEKQKTTKYEKATEVRETVVHRTYKSRLFAMVYEDREELLCLYNAINGTDYTDSSKLEINTLENAIYLSMKNDISFIIDMRLELYEHQSTFNPNLPLRDLMYVSDLYSSYTRNMNLYGTKALSIPTPHFVVFYNGKEDKPEEMEIEDAVERAITECIREGVLADFLRKNRAEAKKMSIYEYDEERQRKFDREEGREEGIKKGEENLLKLIRLMKVNGDVDFVMEIIDNKALRDQMYEKYNLSSEKMED